MSVSSHSQTLCDQGNLLLLERFLLEKHTINQLHRSIRREQSPKSSYMIDWTAQTQIVEHLADCGNDLREWIASFEEGAVRRQMNPIILDSFTRHHIAFAKTKPTRSQRCLTHGVERNNDVVLFLRPMDEATSIFCHQADLWLSEQTSPL